MIIVQKNIVTYFFAFQRENVLLQKKDRFWETWDLAKHLENWLYCTTAQERQQSKVINLLFDAAIMSFLFVSVKWVECF